MARRQHHRLRRAGHQRAVAGQRCGGASEEPGAQTRRWRASGSGTSPRCRSAVGYCSPLCTSGCVTQRVHVLDLAHRPRSMLLGDAVSASYLPDRPPALRPARRLRHGGAVRSRETPGHRAGRPGARGGADRPRAVPFLAWSPCGRAGVHAGQQRGARYTRSSVSAGMEPRRRSTRAWHGGFNSFALSPDGRRMAVGVGLAAGTLGVWIKQLDRGPFSRLTFGGQDRRPAWSPDGRDVAFIRDSLTRHQCVRPRGRRQRARPAARAARPARSRR